MYEVILTDMPQNSCRNTADNENGSTYRLVSDPNPHLSQSNYRLSLALEHLLLVGRVQCSLKVVLVALPDRLDL